MCVSTLKYVATRHAHPYDAVDASVMDPRTVEVDVVDGATAATGESQDPAAAAAAVVPPVEAEVVSDQSDQPQQAQQGGGEESYALADSRDSGSWEAEQLEAGRRCKLDPGL